MILTTHSTIQWVKGKQYLSPEDLDSLIGGPRRPKSKTMIERERAKQEQERLVRMKKQPSSSSRENMSRYRDDDDYDTPKSEGALGGIQNTLNDLGQSASQYMNGLDDMVKDAKTSVFKASFKSRFFG